MKVEKILNVVRKFTFIRLRCFNIKLWGDKRIGLFREFSADEVVTLIKDFKQLSAHNESNTPTPNIEKELFRAGSNYAILSRLCEQYYIYEGSDKLQKKIISEVEEIINAYKKALKDNESLELDNVTYGHINEKVL